MEQELARATTTDGEALTLADLDAYMGVIPDPTGDYAAGRTVFFADTQEFLDAIESRVSKSD